MLTCLGHCALLVAGWLQPCTKPISGRLTSTIQPKNVLSNPSLTYCSYFVEQMWCVNFVHHSGLFLLICVRHSSSIQHWSGKIMYLFLFITQPRLMHSCDLFHNFKCTKKLRKGFTNFSPDLMSSNVACHHLQTMNLLLLFPAPMMACKNVFSLFGICFIYYNSW